MKQKVNSDESRAPHPKTTLVSTLGLSDADYNSAVTALAAGMGDVPFDRVEAPETALAAGAHDRVVVLLRSPEVSLALALAGSDDPAEGVEAWATAREALISRLRHGRRRITLVDVELFERHDARAWKALSRRLGLKPDVEAPLAVDTFQRPTPVHDVAARMLIQFDQRAREIADELSLSILGPGLSTSATDAVTMLLGSWTDISSSVDHLLSINDLQAEAHQKLLAESAQTSTEMDLLQENLTLAAIHTEARLAELAELPIVRDELATANDNLKATRSELSLLREGITLQCAAAEKLAASEIAHRKTIRDLREQLSNHRLQEAKCTELQKRLDMQVEMEQRLRRLMGARILAEARTATELKSELSVLRREHESVQADRANVSETLSRTQAHLTTLEGVKGENELLQSELGRFYSSKSWKLTAPLRSVRRRFKKSGGGQTE